MSEAEVYTGRGNKIEEIQSRLENLSQGQVLDVDNLSPEETRQVQDICRGKYFIREQKKGSDMYALQILKRD